MNKKEIQQRVLQNGKPLALNKFTWNEATKTFSSNENGLVIDFSDIDSATIDCRHSATIKCWDDATINCGYSATIDCWDDATINCGDHATIKCRGDQSAIINRNIFEVIQPKNGDTIQICPRDIPGHLNNGIYSRTGKQSIIADYILSEIVSQKGNVYKVINYGESEQSYLVKEDDRYAHGKTLKEARDSLVYKLADRDKSKYEHLTLDSILTKEEAITCYMAITGACASGTRYFVEQNQDKIKSKYTVAEIIELTKEQFGNEGFIKFFTK